MKTFTLQKRFEQVSSHLRARLLSRTAWMVVSLWSRSVTTRFMNREVPERFRAEGKNVIYAFFHGDLLGLLHAHRDAGFLVPASESRDGEIMARVLGHFGFEVVRGSTRRNGHKALLALIRGMRRGKTVALAVDGPRGPLYEVKAGAAYLAGSSKAPIIPVAVAAKQCMVLKTSWDKLMIPAPFTECLVRYGDPLYVKDNSRDAIGYTQRKLEADLRRLTHEVAQGCNGGGRQAFRGREGLRSR